MIRAMILVAPFAFVFFSCGRDVTESANRSPLIEGSQTNTDLANDPRVTGFDEKTVTAAALRADNSRGNTPASTETPRQQGSLSPEEIFCPDGFSYSSDEKLCVSGNEAYGPFTRTMISLCKKYGGGESACESNLWNRSFAAKLRLSSECPRGAELDSERSVCREGSEAFGPFKKSDVEHCLQLGGGAVCKTMRWHVSFVGKKKAADSLNDRLFQFYSKRENYNLVFQDVLKFYPTGRSNGCVAFMSSALRRVGVPVPIGEYLGGESVSLVTKPFARFLIERLGWQKILNANSLQPGDVVLTEDDSRYPGYPAHTYMFYGWSDQRAGIGWVIDNQDFIHERNVFGYGTYNFTPFAYALRAPE